MHMTRSSSHHKDSHDNDNEYGAVSFTLLALRSAVAIHICGILRGSVDGLLHCAVNSVEVLSCLPVLYFLLV